MKIAIVGAGVIGVTTAHVLAQAGADVHVFEQGSSAAQGASFAQHGVFGADSVQALFAPAQLAKLHTSWRQAPRHLGLIIKAALTSRKHHAEHTQQLQALARHSNAMMQAHLTPLDLNFEQAQGLLTVGSGSELDALFSGAGLVSRSTGDNDQAADQTAINSDSSLLDASAHGLQPATKYLDGAHIAALQPAMCLVDANIQGVYHPEESYGNCALFTKQLRAALGSASKGTVQYHFNQSVQTLQSIQDVEITQPERTNLTAQPWTAASKVHGARWLLSCQLTNTLVDTNAAMPAALGAMSQHRFDAVVVCAGAATSDLIAGMGLKYPVLPTCAYSVTFAIDSMLDAPRCAVRDAETGCVLVPIGQRLRVSGHHHIGLLRGANRKAYKALVAAVQQWFPFAVKVSDASYDTSHSCVAIDSKPIIGQTTQAGLYVNFAHGAHAWALAFGSAQWLADDLLPAAYAGREHLPHSAANAEAFSPNRFF